MEEDPLELYGRLIAGYRCGYHMLIETDHWAVVCASPELFFTWNGTRVVTQPIKGTAARGRWVAEDLGKAEALSASAKERAENVMVVDMLRNDLGRIAVPGSVAVPSLARLERHPLLWQLTSAVTATTRPGTSLPDLFAALFPCASVTGAPKVAAMSLIADLERSPRGVYCGAVGFLPPRTGARFAVAIRTVVIDKLQQIAEYGSGGGITSDSSPRGEWEEISLKARSLTRATRETAAHCPGLIETMRCSPALTPFPVRHLARHLGRLTSSASYFGLPLPDDLEQQILAATDGIDEEGRLRLVLHPDGRIDIDITPLDEFADSNVSLCVDSHPVHTREIRLYHKTTDRQIFEERAHRHPHADDVVLVNQRGEVTETTRANLAVYLDRWYTPPLDCGLLPGVERARLLEEGTLAERVILVGELLQAPRVAIVSSLRGWRQAQVLTSCPASASR